MKTSLKGMGDTAKPFLHSNSPLRKVIKYQRCLRGALAPLFNLLPLSFEGEGDKGGEVDTILYESR